MTLEDGLDIYRKTAGSDWDFTLQVEAATERSKELVRQYGDSPTESSLAQIRGTLIDIEKWKAMCLRERMGNAAQNSARTIWDSFRGAITAASDLDAILWVMRLKGFGSSQDEETGLRRAKVASAVLRFLDPKNGGVVDWRTIAVMSQLRESAWQVDLALKSSRRLDTKELRELYDLVDEKVVCSENEVYRSKRSHTLPRAADVEMAIFGLSLEVWPMRDGVAA